MWTTFGVHEIYSDTWRSLSSLSLTPLLECHCLNFSESKSLCHVTGNSTWLFLSPLPLSLSISVGPSALSSLTLQLCKWINLVAASLMGKVEWWVYVRAQWNIHVCVYPHVRVCEREWNINTRQREGNRWRKRDTMCMFHCETVWVRNRRWGGECKTDETQHVVMWCWNLHLFCIFVYLCHDIWKGEEWFICHKLCWDQVCVLCIFLCPLRQMFITWSPKIESYPLINHVPALLSSSFPGSLQEREERTVTVDVSVTELDLCKSQSVPYVNARWTQGFVAFLFVFQC